MSEGIRKIRGKRRGLRFAPKAIIAILLAITIMLNYMTFFLPKAQAATVSLEQQLDIYDYTGATGSTTYVSNGGTARWTPGSYSGTVTAYFEAVICNTGYDGGKAGWQNATTTVGLFYGSDTLVTNSEVTVTQGSCSYTRSRSSSISLAGSTTDYYTRIKTSDTGFTAYIKAARIIIVQTNATWITDTETQIPIGDSELNWTYASYTTLTSSKIYMYDAGKFTPAPTIYFEATLQASAGSTTCNSQLYNKTDSAAVSGSEVSATPGTTQTLVRSNSISLDGVNDDEYVVQVYRSAGSGNCHIQGAKIILVQSDTTNGITALETLQQYINQNVNVSAGSYTDGDFPNQYAPSNFAAGTFAYYFESTLKSVNAVTLYSKLENDTDSNEIDDDAGCSGNSDPTSELSTSATSYTRLRSSELSTACDWPSASKEMDSRYYRTGSFTAYIASSWLVIQASSLQVPENLLFFLPVVFFLPRIIKKIKTMRKREILVAQVKDL